MTRPHCAQHSRIEPTERMHSKVLSINRGVGPHETTSFRDKPLEAPTSEAMGASKQSEGAPWASMNHKAHLREDDEHIDAFVITLNRSTTACNYAEPRRHAVHWSLKRVLWNGRGAGHTHAVCKPVQVCPLVGTLMDVSPLQTPLQRTGVLLVHA